MEVILSLSATSGVQCQVLGSLAQEKQTEMLETVQQRVTDMTKATEQLS